MDYKDQRGLAAEFWSQGTASNWYLGRITTGSVLSLFKTLFYLVLITTLQIGIIVSG